MATEKRLIEANAFEANIRKMFISYGDGTYPGDYEAMIHDETLVDVLETIEEAPTVDAIPVKDLERILSTTPGLELWDYQKRGIMSAVNRLCGKEKNDG